MMIDLGELECIPDMTYTGDGVIPCIDLSKKIDEQNKIIDYFSNSDSITTITNEDGSITFSSNTDLTIDESLTVDNDTNPISTAPSKSTSINLLDIMKDNNDNSNIMMENQNSLLQAQLILQADQINEQKKSNKINQALVDSNLALVQAVNNGNANQEFHNSFKTAKNVMSYYKLDYELNGSDEDEMGSLQILKENMEEIKGALNTQADIQLEKLGIDRDILDIKKEIHYFEKSGVSTLKDSLGQTIKPREAKALKDAEQGIEEKRMNNVNHCSILDETEKELDDLYSTNLIDTVLDYYKGGDNA